MRDPSQKKVSLGLKVGLVTVVLLTVAVTALFVYIPWFYVSRNNVKEIVGQIKARLGVNCAVLIKAPGEVPRSQGKAVRVKDLRKKV